MSWSIGDRFYFYRNMTDSDTIALGFKGVIDDIIKSSRINGKTIYCCDGYGFAADEIKPIARVEINSSIHDLLSKTLSDNPRLQKMVNDFRNTDHGKDFDGFDLMGGLL